MADGGQCLGVIGILDDDDDESLPRDGIHLLRRARSVAPVHERRLDIYRAEKRIVNGKSKWQTVKVGTTDTADIEQAEIELKRYCLRNMEAKLAQQRADDGKPPAIDMLCSEVYVEYMLAKGENNSNADMFRGVIRDARRAWPPNTRVSHIVRSMQLQFVEVNRKLKTKPWHAPGEPEAPDEFHDAILPSDHPDRHYKDSTIESRLNLVFAMFRWAHAEGKQVLVPGKIRDKEWKAVLASPKRVFTYDEMCAIFNAAGRPLARRRIAPYSNIRRPLRHEGNWRGLTTWVNTAARAMAGHDLTWDQCDRQARIIHLNPPGRAVTSKRRPMLPMTRTFAAELESWLVSGEVDPTFVVTHKGRHRKRQVWFDTLLAQAGVGYGSVQTLRRTVRTMFARKGVPNRIADRWTGHDEEEGADTGQQYYVLLGVGDDLRPFFQPCVEALEEWFDELQKGVDYPIGKRYARGKDPMKISFSLPYRAFELRAPRHSAPATQLVRLAPASVTLRSNCVATLSSNLLNRKESEAN